MKNLHRNGAISRLIESYEKQIKELQTENAELKNKLNPRTLYGIGQGKVETLSNVIVEYHFDKAGTVMGGWIETNELGKYVFLTESEAEKALKEKGE